MESLSLTAVHLLIGFQQQKPGSIFSLKLCSVINQLQSRKLISISRNNSLVILSETMIQLNQETYRGELRSSVPNKLTSQGHTADVFCEAAANVSAEFLSRCLPRLSCLGTQTPFLGPLDSYRLQQVLLAFPEQGWLHFTSVLLRDRDNAFKAFCQRINSNKKNYLINCCCYMCVCVHMYI